MNWHDRNQKARCRSYAVEAMDEPAKVALFLPSNTQLCIKEALETGVINRNTRIIAVEKDAQIAARIERYLDREFNFPYLLHCDELTNLHLADDPDVQRYGIDLAYIDLCGNLKLSYAKWAVRQHGVFNPGARVSWTFCARVRLNALLDQMSSTWASFTFGNTRARIERKLMQSTFTSLGFYGWDGCHANDNAGRYDRATIEGVYGAMVANYKVDIVHCIRYCDTSPMLFVNFHIVGQKDTPTSRHTCPRDSKLLAQAYYEITGKDIFVDKPGRRGRPRIRKIKVELTPGQKAIKARLINAHGLGSGCAKWAWHPQNPNGCRKE